VDDLVGADIPSVGELLAADFAVVWTFPGMASFVCLNFYISRDNAWELVFYITFRFPS
jgi:hypothetical protein